ncbi:hypothetical protein [Psychrobacter sp. KH172YL61]|nr:hypothetical protein [Psychrobacter sp. KH172YL61]
MSKTAPPYIAALSLTIASATGTPDGYFLVFPEGGDEKRRWQRATTRV